MSTTWSIYKRELGSYFATPIAAVFLVIFLFLTSWFTFSFGGFLDAGQASLQSFFSFHPWLFLILIPAIAMRLWAEERKTGSIELLMTLPVTLWQAIIAKYLAAWTFTSFAILLTFPLWITVNYLGSPDNGVIVAGYIGSILMAGSYLAIGSAVSASTKNQVIAFIVTVVICLGFILVGHTGLTNFLAGYSQGLANAVSSLSFLTHFSNIIRGVLDLRDLIFFGSVIIFMLFFNMLIIDARKGQ